MPNFAHGSRRLQIAANDGRRLFIAGRNDLRRVVEYIAREDPAVAIAFAKQLEHHCSLLSKTPHMGRERPDVGPGVRSLVEGRYLIFYRFSRDIDRVEILRVWHGRRRLPRLGQR